MNDTNDKINSLSDQEVCTIVVLYDGPATRGRAMSACDYLVNQFWPEVELKFHWWRTDFLRDAALAMVAADAAAVSDFMIICSDRGGELSPALESWFESWLERRGERTGALVDLSAAPLSTQREVFLREVSRRGKFDYLTAVPDGVGNALNPNSSAGEMSVIGDNFLGESRPPSHYGLNE